MSLHVHRAVRADRLAAGLAELLSRPLSDPFTVEVVGVPTPGVERWLVQSLSHRLGAAPGLADGVCAGIEFVSPRRLTARALAEGTRVDPTSDPWAVHRAVWPLLAVIDRCRHEPWAAPLWSHLTRGGESDVGAPAAPGGTPTPPGGTPQTPPDGEPRGGRRLAVARHLAELFARYAATRPAMLQRWRHGSDVGGSGLPLPPDRAWQAEVWRRFRVLVDVPDPAERLATGRAHLLAHPDSTDLPARLSVFGPTRLEPDQLATLVTLAAHRDVHLWLSHPSPALWRQVAALPPSPRGPRRTAPVGRDAGVARHRLLRYLGRDVVELQRSLAAVDASGPVVELSHDDAPGSDPEVPTTLLARLQHDLALDVELGLQPSGTHVLGDDSISLHACHGPDRQVEVLREVLLGLLADDPTLEPRDVIVMCPDVEAFAPLVSASFGLDPSRPDGVGDGVAAEAAEHPGHRLRVRLADRSLRQLNPLLALISHVLTLAEARITAADLLDLLATAPVARLFRFTEDDLARLGDLVPRSGVRWGLDAPHRDRYQMAGFGQNTWAAGLDRLLLGVTMSERDEHFIGTALPMADIDSSDVELLGRLAEAVDRIGVVLRRCAERQSLSDWVQTLRAAVDGLSAVSAADGWQLSHAYAALGDLLTASRGEPAGAGADDAEPVDDVGWSGTVLSPADVRALLENTLRGRPSRANFRTGTLTLCTMQPMRSVPHRVVCLLGVDDGVFPRSEAVDGDDLLADDPWVGDRDRRSEDRQLMLDAITAATERLVVLYSGADPRTGRTRPPAVPVGELLDTLERTVASPDDRPLREHLITRHPLQPFDPGNFTRGPAEPTTVDTAPVGHGRRPFSFDRHALAGARALVADRVPVPPPGPLVLEHRPPPPVVALTDLVRFFHHPAKALLRTRAGLYVGGEEETTDEEIPTVLDGLQSWAIGDRMLRRRLAGAELGDLVAAEWRRGELPPQAMGVRTVKPVADTVAGLDAVSADYRQGASSTLDLDARVGGVTVTGTAGPIFGDRWVTVGYSKLAAKHRLAGWLQLLALTVTAPDRPWQVITIGRAGRSALGPLPAETAALVLDDLVQLYTAGQDELVPLPVASAAEYARIRSRNWSVEQALPALLTTWSREDDAAWALTLEPPGTLDSLLATPARAAERRGPVAEPSRFGTLARRVWSPLLRAEELT